MTTTSLLSRALVMVSNDDQLPFGLPSLVMRDHERIAAREGCVTRCSA